MADESQIHERGGALQNKLDELLRQQRELSNRLRHGQEQFKRLARSVWSVQEQERRKLARELHDGLGQNLNAIINLLGMALIQPDPSREYMEKARELAEMTLQETRELSRFLRPTMLDDLGLEAALRWLARTMAEANDWQILLNLPEPMPVLDGEQSTLVFRAAQESLTNAAKYAHARNVDMNLYQDGQRLHLVVLDDGRGCDIGQALADGHEKGSGLGGMRDRVRAYNGELHIESRPGHGFKITVDIPLAAEGKVA
jgi:signal transduction histidine kinase